MSGQPRLHDDDIAVDVPLVRSLIDRQFPAWANQPIRRVTSAGTVNAIFRLGDDFVVRIPRAQSYVWDIELLGATHQWLRWAQPQLPLAIPEPVAIGEGSDDYPWPWCVHRWIAGSPLEAIDLSGSVAAAERLAGFVDALHALRSADGPRSPKAVSRSAWAPHFERVVGELGDQVDQERIRAAWQHTLTVPSWPGPFVWTHADLLPGNLLAHDGELVAVLDFECLGIGDPALDLTAAWAVFDRTARNAFRRALAIDDATWCRAANFALRHVAGIGYYETTNPVFSVMSRRCVSEVVDDFERGAIP